MAASQATDIVYIMEVVKIVQRLNSRLMNSAACKIAHGIRDAGLCNSLMTLARKGANAELDMEVERLKKQVLSFA